MKYQDSLKKLREELAEETEEKERKCLNRTYLLTGMLATLLGFIVSVVVIFSFSVPIIILLFMLRGSLWIIGL